MVGPMNAIFKKLITYGYPKLCDVFLYNSKWKIIRYKATKCDRLFIALAHTIWWNPMNASKLYLSICCCCCCLLVLLNECCLIKSVGQFQQGIFLEKPPLTSHIDPATFFRISTVFRIAFSSTLLSFSDFSVVNICWFVHCLLSYGHRELWLSLICLLFSHLTVFFLVSLFSPRRNAYHTLLCAVLGVIVTQFRAVRSRYYRCPTTLVKYQVKFDQGSFIRIFKTSIFSSFRIPFLSWVKINGNPTTATQE